MPAKENEKAMARNRATDVGVAPSYGPFAAKLLNKTLLVLLGTAFLALCSWIEVPMYPVPMTMQTFGVVLIGFLFGWRLGGVTVVAWLVESAMGLPVLAGGAGAPSTSSVRRLVISSLFPWLPSWPVCFAMCGPSGSSPWSRRPGISW